MIREVDLPRFTVKLRRDLPGGPLRSAAEQLDGKTFAFRFGWHIEDDDRRYPGEIAWIAEDGSYPRDAPTWIASGDLVEAA
jgi:hypothetical protein